MGRGQLTIDVGTFLSAALIMVSSVMVVSNFGESSFNKFKGASYLGTDIAFIKNSLYGSPGNIIYSYNGPGGLCDWVQDLTGKKTGFLCGGRFSSGTVVKDIVNNPLGMLDMEYIDSNPVFESEGVFSVPVFENRFDISKPPYKVVQPVFVHGQGSQLSESGATIPLAKVNHDLGPATLEFKRLSLSEIASITSSICLTNTRYYCELLDVGKTLYTTSTIRCDPKSDLEKDSCRDPDCACTTHCTPEDCEEVVGYSSNTLEDCTNVYDCNAMPNCVENTGIDDDGDGDANCEDSDCMNNFDCKNFGEDCSTPFDDDNDLSEYVFDGTIFESLSGLMYCASPVYYDTRYIRFVPKNKLCQGIMVPKLHNLEGDDYDIDGKNPNEYKQGLTKFYDTFCVDFDEISENCGKSIDVSLFKDQVKHFGTKPVVIEWIGTNEGVVLEFKEFTGNDVTTYNVFSQGGYCR